MSKSLKRPVSEDSDPVEEGVAEITQRQYQDFAQEALCPQSEYYIQFQDLHTRTAMTCKACKKCEQRCVGDKLTRCDLCASRHRTCSKKSEFLAFAARLHFNIDNPTALKLFKAYQGSKFKAKWKKDNNNTTIINQAPERSDSHTAKDNGEGANYDIDQLINDTDQIEENLVSEILTNGRNKSSNPAGRPRKKVKTSGKKEVPMGGHLESDETSQSFDAVGPIGVQALAEAHGQTASIDQAVIKTPSVHPSPLTSAAASPNTPQTHNCLMCESHQAQFQNLNARYMSLVKFSGEQSARYNDLCEEILKKDDEITRLQEANRRLKL